MGFDDLFDNHDKHRKHGYYGGHNHHHDSYDYAGRGAEYHRGKHQMSYFLINKIWNNRKLRIAFVILAIIIVLAVILLVVAIVPILVKLVDYILQNGLQSIFDGVISFIEKLWKGAGK